MQTDRHDGANSRYSPICERAKKSGGDEFLNNLGVLTYDLLWNLVRCWAAFLVSRCKYERSGIGANGGSSYLHQDIFLLLHSMVN